MGGGGPVRRVRRVRHFRLRRIIDAYGLGRNIEDVLGRGGDGIGGDNNVGDGRRGDANDGGGEEN